MRTQITLFFILLLSIILSNNVNAQKKKNVINLSEQNISIVADNEPLESVIGKICKQFNLDFDYNSKLIRGKNVNLNVSNKSVLEVMKGLMDDFSLIFDIEGNLLVIRDYVPFNKSVDYKKLYETPSSGFTFDNDKKKSFEISFKMINNLIIIPVSINGSDSMNFILDTGVKDPIITELTLVQELNLNYMQAVELRGLGNETTTQAYQSGDNTISLPGLTAKHQKINVILDEDFQISQIIGMPVHGLIGFNLFKHYIIKVDYQAEKIKLTKPPYYEYEPRTNDIVLPMTLVKGKPVIKSEIVQDSNTVIPVNLLIDTGASDAMWLSVKTNPALQLPKENIYAFLGAGLGGEIFGNKGRVNALWMGGRTMPKPIVSYPDSGFINQVMFSEQRNGSIGGEILRRFTITFDYYNQRLIFRPNSHIDDPFYYNMSGLEIINPVPGLPVFTISNVIENSPSWNAGIRKGDQLISINYRNLKEMSLNDINLSLRQRQNKKIYMTLLRNGEEFKTNFVLSELF